MSLVQVSVIMERVIAFLARDSAFYIANVATTIESWEVLIKLSNCVSEIWDFGVPQFSLPFRLGNEGTVKGGMSVSA